MLDFICMGRVDLPELVESNKIQNAKFLPTVGLKPTSLRFVACMMLYQLSFPGFNESFSIKVTFIHTCHWYKLENDEVERILSCTCTVLCYIFEYIYIGQIAMRCTSPVFAFNMQNMSKHFTRSGSFKLRCQLFVFQTWRIK